MEALIEAQSNWGKASMARMNRGGLGAWGLPWAMCSRALAMRASRWVCWLCHPELELFGVHGCDLGSAGSGISGGWLVIDQLDDLLRVQTQLLGFAGLLQV